ncbi:MAG: GNAT family N-acetyltransferase [Cyanobacteria bacterium J06626_6]
MINWIWKDFSALTADELYDLLRLRQQIFILEQQCLYLDIDGLDECAWHLLAMNGAGELVGYLRVVAPEKKYAEPSMGRVLIRQDVRGKGLGSRLVDRGIQYVRSQFSIESIRISAQLHLRAFYERFGFQSMGEPYLEDGIPHIEMLLAKKLM